MFSDKTIVGLDIGTDSIKMVEISHTESGRQLLTYGVARHALNLDGYWDSSRLRQLGTIIEDLLNSGDFTGVKTVMSVQSKDVYVTTMDFEASWNKKMIQDEIDRQAPYFLPYPPDEMRLSWSLIKNDPRIMAYTGKQRVIINALPDFVIENSKNLLEHVNLDGAALENQTISQLRAALTPDHGNTVLVDIGGKHTTFSIIVDGVLRSSSHIAIGTDKIGQDLALALGVDEPIGEYFKRDLNLVNLFHLPKQVMDNLTVLKSELETFVELNKKVSQDPQKVVVTGGGVYTPGFIEFFREFPIPVYVANCLRQTKLPDTYHPYIIPMVNQLSTAIGLALRNDV
jgi:Tfp pilus assembly PilM family ATPase